MEVGYALTIVTVLGAMMGLSLMAVPVLLDTTTEPAQLFHQWTRMYHYGHQALPTMAIATFALYGYTALSKRTAKKAWGVFAAAGLTTVSILPFTWIVMVPTNNTLFRLEAESRTAPVASWEEARNLVIKWSCMHLVRSLLPLAGAILGSMGIFEKLVF